MIYKDSPAPGGSRVPPHSIEAEESVLGGVLIDNESIHDARERLMPEDLYRPSHQKIYEAMTQLADRSEPIDAITLSNQLKKNKLFEEVGGFDIISRLSNVAPTSAHVSYYADIVKEFSLRRTMIHEASQIINDGFTGEGDVRDFLDISEQRILGVSQKRAGSTYTPVRDIVQDSIKLIEELFNRKDQVTGVPTGFNKMDEMTAGFQPSDLIIIAARPSMGKTALALNIACTAGVKNNKGVAIFSLEMSKEQLILRMLCAEAAVDNSRVRTGHLQETDFPSLVNAAAQISECPIFIDDTPAITPMEIRAKCRRLNRQCPLGLIIVDYLQLMRNPAYSNSREQEISNISRSLKALAKELNVPVIALSQLNRSVESRNDKRPMMSDLRESGAIEQDADIIMFIYRDEVYNKETAEKGTAEIIIAKQRNGPIGSVKLAFSPSLTRFDNLAYSDAIPEGGEFTSDGFDHLNQGFMGGDDAEDIF